MAKNKSVTCINKTIALILSENGSDIEEMENQIIALSQSPDGAGENSIDLFIDLGEYTVLRSTFFGVLGSTIQYPHISRVALCNMSAATEKMARRFGIRDGSVSTAVASREIRDCGLKFRISPSLPDALYALGKECTMDHCVA